MHFVHSFYKIKDPKKGSRRQEYKPISFAYDEIKLSVTVWPFFISKVTIVAKLAPMM